jgi:hypothetical protein
MKPGGVLCWMEVIEQLIPEANKAIVNPMKKIFLYFLLLSFTVWSAAQATTIQKFEFQEIVAISGLIVEGEVLSTSHFAEDDLIYTRVLIKIDDVLKGLDPGEYIELNFLGGKQDGKSVQIAGQDIPEKGERGFYFIEDLDMKSVNPLTGWSQGHFKIVTDDKGHQILKNNSQVDSQALLNLNGSKNSALATKLRNMKFSSTLVEKASFVPATPDELREAVMELHSGVQ